MDIIDNKVIESDDVNIKEEGEEEESCIFNENYHDHGNECWPDHITSSVVLDDVSRLNATRVHSMYQVISIEDIQSVLSMAASNELLVSIRGTKHSMGGHTLNHDGVVIDMQYINHMKFNEVGGSGEGSVIVGTGALWSDLIQYLNQFGRAPRTLQSYSSFSIGGTLSVNGHGITTDYCLAESVISFRLVRVDGSLIECSRDAESEEARELFGLCIGGYGLFGIIYDVCLKVKNNYRLTMDTVMTPLHDLPHVYEPMIDGMLQDEIDIKLARIDITNFDVADIYLFRRTTDTPTVSNLPVKPKEMSMASKTMYKWFAGPLREIRFAIEHSLGVALDWSEVSDSNLLLFESAKPLAQLYSPWLLIDDTFILQEYFVPRESFNTWVAEARKIVLNQINKETKITLLNITIRFVHHDTDTVLPYSASKGGSYAFVFYFRIRRTTDADELLKSYHKKLSDITLEEGGTFYLPYRHHYTAEQLQQAYPNFNHFVKRQQHYDPTQRFSNHWWNHYAKNNISIDNQKQRIDSIPQPLPIIKQKSKEEIQLLLESVTLHRDDSFRKLLKDRVMRRTFADTFLVDILALANNGELLRMMNTASWDKRLKNDDDIYMNLCNNLHARSGPFGELVKVWKQTKQLSDQRKELVRETVSVLSRVGMVGKVHDFVSIGDHGKLIAPLRKSLRMQGKAWIVHDAEADETDVPATLERGIINQKELGTFVKIDYNHIRKNGTEFAEIPDGSVDLVTMNQGLHHLPPKQIPNFLQGIYRILRPGGCLIIREHDLDEQRNPLPMLDCAHMVFNVLTGVKPLDEKGEVRGFRSLVDWRTIVEFHGFRDTMVYEMQPNDPTVDIMMCFRKVEDQPSSNNSSPSTLSPSLYSYKRQNRIYKSKYNDKHYTPIPETRINLALNQLPHVTLNMIKGLIGNLRSMLPRIQQWLASAVRTMIPKTLPGMSDAAELILKSYVNPFLVMLERFDPLTEAAMPQSNTSDNIIPDELFLLVHVLRARVKKTGGVFESAIIGVIDQLVGFKNEVITEVTEATNSKSVTQPLIVVSEISFDEVKKEMVALFEAIPQLSNMESIVVNFGLSQRGTDLIRSFIPTDISPDSLAKWISEKLSTANWTLLKKALVDIKRYRATPTVENMCKQEGSPWNLAAMAVLSTPSIQFTSTQVSMAGWVGLGPIVQLWSKAQNSSKKPSIQSATTRQLTKEMTDQLNLISPLKTYEGKATDLEGVVHVVSAKYIHYSLTGLFKDVETDITEASNEALHITKGVLSISQIKIPTSGLKSFRAGDHKYRIQYRTVPTDNALRSTKMQATALKFSQLLAKNGHLDGSFHANSGPLNHYKLPEWMQVEMIQVFGSFMEHTPWYRFPFTSVLQSYFSVLFKEFGIVSQEQGVMGALTDQGFITDLVPGVVMSIILGQMALLALPIRKMLGDSYDTSGLYETLVILSPEKVNWNSIDKRVKLPKGNLDDGISIIQIPPFKEFSDILINIARNSPLTSIMQISNNSIIQLKLAIRKSNTNALLNQIDENFNDAKVNFNYNLFPSTGMTEQQQLKEQISIDVQVLALLSFIRFIDSINKSIFKNDIDIIQIYDYYA